MCWVKTYELKDSFHCSPMPRHSQPDVPVLRKKGLAPWHRGPAAFAIRCRADDILERLAALPETHLSLRRTAAVLGVSTQPLRIWHRDGWLNKGPAGRKFPVEELRRFVLSLKRYAKPHEMRERLRRFGRIKAKGQPLPRAWDTLRQASFKWPKGRDLTPREVAERVGCSASLVTKAIEAGFLQAYRPGRVRWRITKRDWNQRGMFW